MSPHVDILDDRERLGRPFLGSIVFHVLLIIAVAGVGIVRSGGIRMGEEKPGGTVGTVAITPVGSIPLPSNPAPKNPVANDTHSQVPIPKEVPKPAPKSRPEPPKKVDDKALAIPGGYTKKQYAQVDKFRQQQQDRPNQLYSNSGQQLSSDMFAMQGSGRMGLGDNSPLGNQFGAYARILRDMVASKWRTTDIAASIRTAPQVIVTFTLHRDGSASNVHVTQSSGMPALDRSGVRAILDAAPFPKLPPQFPKDQTDIDFVFELKR